MGELFLSHTDDDERYNNANIYDVLWNGTLMYFSIELSSNWWSLSGGKLLRAKRNRTFPSEGEKSMFLNEKISSWSTLLIVKDNFDSIIDSPERLTVGIIQQTTLMDAGWINYEFILTFLSLQST